MSKLDNKNKNVPIVVLQKTIEFERNNSISSKMINYIKDKSI